MLETHFLRALALRDVDDRRQREVALRGRDGVEPDLERDLRAVLAQAVDVGSRPHQAVLHRLEILAAQTRVRASKTVRHERLDGTPEQLVARVAENPCALRVGQRDATVAVCDDDRDRSGVYHQA